MQGRRRLNGAFLIELARIRPDPAQPRRSIDDVNVRELAASISSLGILQPIAVRYLEIEDIYQIISGERRYQATKLAGLAEIPCWIQSPEDKEVLLRQVVENWQRADLHPFEIADSLARLRDLNGYAQKQLAEATGKSAGDISKLLKLLVLSPEVQKEAREDPSGSLSRRHLYAMSRLEPAEQSAVAQVVKEQQLGAADTERLVGNRLKRRAPFAKRGAPVTRVQLVTPLATVVLTFRRKAPTTEEIIAALDAAKSKALEAAQPLNIVRAR